VNFLRFILLPFSLIYGLATLIRNKLFDWKILPSKTFDIPVISVGNLSVGGTGKSPHVEYIVRLLKDEFKIATLSRGYKRKSKGFKLAGQDPSIKEIGDEPTQFANKFPSLHVAVDNSRVNGINNLIEKFPELETIILDDAFQHRYVEPGLSILLTDFHKLYMNDFPLPAGRLREFRSGAKRADRIIVTRASKVVSPITRRRLEGIIKPREHQKLYFSYIKHGKFTPIPGFDFKPSKNKYFSILMVTGIANTYPLEIYLKKHCEELEILKFQDHHQYTTKDIEKINEIFNNIFTENKIIITTEKDAMRFREPAIFKALRGLPICYVPIEVVIHQDDSKNFNNQIISYVRENKKNIGIHKKEN